MSATSEAPSKQESGTAGQNGGDRPLRGEEKIQLGLLGLPSFALALAITTVSTYLSEITRRYTHQTAVIGLIIGSEGVMALWVRQIAGTWSDKVRTEFGGRLPFVIVGTIPAGIALALIGDAHSLALVARSEEHTSELQSR